MVAPSPPTKYRFRPPFTEEQLKLFLQVAAGVKIPDRAVCPGHVSPWFAFWRAFNGMDPVQIWIGSRGLAGKTFTNGTLSWAEAVLLGAKVTVLGGSQQQSQRVLETQVGLWAYRDAPRYLLRSQPGARETKLKHGGKIKALAASQTSARGEHPHRLRLDEIDEMDQKVLLAALGQIGPAPGVKGQVVMSSTWHNPNGTMTAMLALAREKKWPVYRWCWRETHESVGGWLTEDAVELVRSTIPESMWNVEYNLQEPSSEGRVFNDTTLNLMFRKDMGMVEGAIGKAYETPRLPKKYVYAHGTDLGLVTDASVIDTLRCDVRPVQFVSHIRLRGVEYSEVGRIHDDRVTRLPGQSVFDMTGVGLGFRSHIGTEAEGFTFTAKSRGRLFMDYVKACETGMIVSPWIEKVVEEHRYVTWDDLYGKGHPPDGVVSRALAWRAAMAMGVQPAGGDSGPGIESFTRPSYWSKF